MSMPSCSGCQVVLVFVNSSFCNHLWFRCNESIKPPLDWWLGSLFVWVGVLCVNEVDASLSLFLTWKGTYLLHPQSGLANHDPVLWVVTLILRLTICWHLWVVTSFPQPNAHVPSNVYSHNTLHDVFTHLQLMLWWTSMVEVVTSC